MFSGKMSDLKIFCLNKFYFNKNKLTMSKTKWSVLDTLFILFTSITILLLIFWIVGQIRGLDTFNQLPGWLVGLTDKIWGFLISSGLSALTYWLKSKHKHSPNYLLWTFITTSFLLALVIGVSVAFNTISPQPDAPKKGQIRFQLTYENAPDQLFFVQQAPVWQQRNIIAQNSGYFEVQQIELPALNENFVAKSNQLITSSEYRENAVQNSIEICFKRIKSKLPEDNCIAVLTYDSNNQIKLDKSDPGCVQLCDNQTTGSISFSDLFTSAFAVMPPPPQVNAGWTVPTLQTLNSKRQYGFSQVDIKSTLLPGNLKDANYYSYAIFVNNTPVYINGFRPEDLKEPFDYDKGIDLSIGLENLNFSGKHDGYENVKVRFSFYQNDQSISTFDCDLNYVALRTMGPFSIKPVDGAAFTWNVNYKTSATVEYEIFNFSGTNLNAANRSKNKLDQAGLKYKDQDLVGIVRPPLNQNPNYGVIVGLVLPSKQIRFTFNKQEANEFLDWIKKQNNAAFHPTAYLYRIKGY